MTEDIDLFTLELTIDKVRYLERLFLFCCHFH